MCVQMCVRMSDAKCTVQGYQQRLPVREYVRDVVRTLSTQYAALAGPVRSGSTLLLLLLLLLLPSSCKRCWPATGLQDVNNFLSVCA
jgi:hypothetical protein